MIEILKLKIAALIVVVLLFSAAPLRADSSTDSSASGRAGGLLVTKSLIYTSSSQRSMLQFRDLSPTARLAFASNSVSDQLMSQSAEFGLGSARLQLTYQDVGRDFTEFTTLRRSNAAPDDVLNQLEKEKGLKRMGFALQLASGAQSPAGGIANGLSWSSIRDKSGQLWTRGFNFGTKNVGFFANMQGSDAGFARIKDLADADKTAMALSIRQQFDPNATAQQVTALDKTQLATGAGLERKNFGLRFGSGSSASWMQMLRITGKGGDIQRTSFKFSGKNFNLFGFKQSIDEGFTRLVDMTGVEKLQFGNEHGMDRFNLGGDMKLGKTLQATMSLAKVSDKNGGMTRNSLGLTGKTFSVAANFMDIDPTFTRILDLADVDKLLLVKELGFKEMDLTGSFSLWKGLSLKSFFYNSDNASQSLHRNQIRNQILYTVDKNTKLAILNDQFSFTAPTGNLSSYDHTNVAVDHSFGKTVSFSGSQDVLNTETGTAVTQTTTTDLNVNYAASKDLTIKARQLTIDQGDLPSAKTGSCNVQWKMRMGLSLAVDSTNTKTNNNRDSVSRRLLLQTTPIAKLGWFRNATLAAGISTVGLVGQTPKTSPAAKIEAGMFGGNMMVEYSGPQAVAGSQLGLRAYKFASDRDPKKWLHFDASYKQRGDLLGKRRLIRAYNMDTRISANTNLNYSYYTNTEGAGGLITPTIGSALRLSTNVGSGLKLLVDYRNDENFLYKTKVSPLMIGLSGKLPYGADFELSLGQNINATAVGYLAGKMLHVKYGHQISADHYLDFEANMTQWQNTNPGISVKDDIEGRIDYKANFNLSR